MHFGSAASWCPLSAVNVIVNNFASSLSARQTERETDSMSSTWASATVLLIVLCLTSAQENDETEVTTVGFSNVTYADSNGEEAEYSGLEAATETTTEMPPEPGIHKTLEGHS